MKNELKILILSIIVLILVPSIQGVLYASNSTINTSVSNTSVVFDMNATCDEAVIESINISLYNCTTTCFNSVLFFNQTNHVNYSSTFCDWWADITSPIVNLLNNSMYVNMLPEDEMNWTFNYTDSSSDSANCTLWEDGFTGVNDISYAYNITNNTASHMSMAYRGVHGWIPIWINCTDESGNEGKSNNISMYNDNVPATVNIITPVNGSNISSNSINITYNLTNAEYEIQEGQIVSYFNISLLNSNGSFNITIISNNSLNTSYYWTGILADYSPGTYMIRVDAINSTGTVFATGNSTYHITTDAVLNIYATDNSTGIPISTFSINLTMIGGTNQYLNSTDNVTTFAIFKNQNYTVKYISSVYNQTTNYNSNSSATQYLTLIVINPSISSICGENQTPSLFFKLYDEENQASLTGNYYYNFNITIAETTYQVYGNVSGSNLSLCINASTAQNWTVNNGEVQYGSTGYDNRRYYVFSGTRISNATTNISLYSLNSSLATAFQITIQADDLTTYDEHYLTLIRWYPELNTYNVVDMGLTDDLSQTIIHSKTLDVDYRMGVYEKDGTLVYLANPIRMICLSTPCEYTLIIPSTTTTYTTLENLQYNWDYNSTTGMVTFNYNDPSQATQTVSLTVYKDTGDNSYSICQNNVTMYTGAVNCNISGWTGNLRAEVTRTASPSIPIAQYFINAITSAFKSSYGMWITLIIALPIIFVLALVSPIAAMIGGVISLIPGLYFGSISWTLIGSLAIMAVIIVHFIKNSQGR